MSIRLLCFVSLLTVMASNRLFSAEAEPQAWKAVQQAIDQGLPKTAIEKLEPIIADAKDNKRHAEAIKAIALKISLEGSIQGNRVEEKIVRMRAEIATAPEEMKPLMESILANWFWHYFQQNRWRFMQRTQTADTVSDDMTTWDLSRILQETSSQFDKALENSELLKKTAITEYDSLLEQGNAPDAYRPTLWDFLVYDAIEFYSSAEQAGARSEIAFDLTADSPIFATASEFVDWQPQTDDTQSPTLKAIRLYQDLLKFHRNDEDRSAMLDADLSRLVFGNNQAFGEEKSARYKAALRRFADQNSKHPIAARALHELATAVHGEEDFVEAKKIANEALTLHPDSVGGKRCYNLIQQIEAPAASVTTERVWNEPWPSIDVRYRNVEKIYFRLVPYSFEEFIQSNRWQPLDGDHDQQRRWISQNFVKSWSADLPKTEDYKEAVEQLPVPEDVKPGSYFLVSSHQADFVDDNNQTSIAEVWVSKLALVLRNRHGSGQIEGFVLDAKTGQPTSGAVVNAWARRGNSNTPLPAARTDKNGFFEILSTEQGNVTLLVTKDGHSLSSNESVSNYRQRPSARTSEQTRFFTDRAIYRPGQTIRYKGICLSVNQTDSQYNTIANRNLSVVFVDANNKEIERVDHRTNDYGSFSGSVTAPRDRLMGRMTLRVEGVPSGQTSIRVEEYKRPKFQTKLQPPQQATRLNEVVNVVGTATAYTGASIDDAVVQWRVVREVRYPIWWSWSWQRVWFPPRATGSQEISHGTTRTDSTGKFEIEFTARPDLSVPKESEPTFQYTLYADVTDSTGETRSDQRSVQVGYTALSASMTTTDWLTGDAPVQIAVRTKTLDGEGQSAEGNVKIFTLKQPEKVTRPPLAGRGFRLLASERDEVKDLSDPNTWELGDLVGEQAFKTDAAGNAKQGFELKPGIYRAKLLTKDRFGNEVTALLPIHVLAPESEKLDVKLPDLLVHKQTSLQPGDTMQTLWGSGYESARAFVEIEHRGKILRSYWTPEGRTQVLIEQEVDESMRGGFTLRTTMVRENRAYTTSRHVEVPWTNKQLSVQWERFVSKLEPAAKETWTAIITGPDAERTAAEMVATLYDASLDAFMPHRWSSEFGVFYRDSSRTSVRFQNASQSLRHLWGNWIVDQRNASLTYRRYPSQLIQSNWGFQFRRTRAMGGYGARGAIAAESNLMIADAAMAPMSAAAEPQMAMAKSAAADSGEGEVVDSRSDEPSGPDVDLSNVSARENLNETAFFFPHLIASEDGTVRMEFTMPEALTEWKFLGFVHDSQLRAGLLTDSIVTSKDLMVQPNPPRFVREGDEIEFTVKVTNQSPTNQTGKVRLTFADAQTQQSVDQQLGLDATDLPFSIAAGQSQSLSWKIAVPDAIGFLTYKAVGSTGRLSDGEQGYLPVLSRRVLVTESLPLPIRGPQTKQFEFEKLLQSADSDTLRHQTLSLQVASNPSWYAVMALPYLMEYPYECSEQVFSRLYANGLANHIATSDPKIERVFEAWRGTPALDSPLEKNEDLKAVALEETPWLRDAQSESQSRRNVGILFDQNRLQDEMKRSLFKLTEAQLEDGSWPWFPGGRGNDYITLYITTGFGRLRHLGVNIDTQPALRSLARLDGWVTKMYSDIKSEDRDKSHLSTTIALYLYGRSFFLADQPVAPVHREAVDFWLNQAAKHWLQLPYRQSQAHMAVALKRFGKPQAAEAIMASIKERSVSDEEMGMFWRETEISWWWYRAPIETQAMMIEAFDEVMNDQQAVEDCKVWLLKQKQTRDWKTTKATADAIYSLLLRGSNLLASDELVRVELGGQAIEPENVEAGTGFYEHRLVKNEIQPEQGNITVRKVDEGVAWGSLHWQYLEDISKVTAHDATPLKLEKKLFVKMNTPQGPTLVAVDGPIGVGDELVVRVILRSDRDMEYLHLKDHRASGTEPINVLSSYKYQDGLGYYESTRDTATHFFIDYLPKGTYVFEYSTRVQLKGDYQTGLASIQCMYAPEFNSHSESIAVRVQ